MFPLTLFPEGGLAGSVITTVWVGVAVMCFFNLRFGWVLSGLVVPGYLVPLLIVKPFAAVVIGVEAVVTYILVWLFSEKLAPGRFPSLFGRDRFMGLVLASVAVRLIFDGILLPEASMWLETHFDRRIDWENNLQSFGLVVISLLANQFWKPGLARGLVMAAITIGLTYVIVRFGLMELTNFRISGVYYLYEGLSSSIYASPKAYMILILTAIIASHYNVKYGWDFSGILIPALIALQWYQPTKILTSFGEAIVIYAIARAILRMPFMANVTMEGGRKLLLFFNISFAWKMALGWVIVWQGFDVKTSDYFGFGYLLSTLIAIKAHDKDIFPRLARSTLQVSLAGAVMGNIAGFTISAATGRVVDTSEASGEERSERAGAALDELVVNAIGDAHVRRARGGGVPLPDESLASLEKLVELLDTDLKDVATHFDQTVGGWRVVRVGGSKVAILRADGQGHELLVFDPSVDTNRAIVLPDPSALPGLGAAGLALYAYHEARWLAVGVPFAETDVVDVLLANTRAKPIALTAGNGQPRLFLGDASASAIDVSQLRRHVPDLSLTLGKADDTAAAQPATRRLDAATIARLANPRGATEAAAENCALSRLPNERAAWNELAQLAFVRYEIAAPFVADVRNGIEPRVAQSAARLAGMDIARCTIGGKAHWRLASALRDEGNIFLVEGEAPQRAVLTFENERGALPARIGTDIYRSWGGDALFVHTRSDSFLRDPRSAFDVVWQEWVRSQDGVEDSMAFQLRARPREAIGYGRNVKVLMAKDRIGPDRPAFNALREAVATAGYPTEVVTNAPHQAGVEARPSMSMRYLASAGNPDAVDDRRYAFGWLMFSGIGERATTGRAAR